MPGPIKRSVTLSGHRTSISLEADFWAALQDIAAKQQQSVSTLITEIDRQRSLGDDQTPGLSSAIRLFVLHHYRNRVEDHSQDPDRQFMRNDQGN
ncbi:MAG TPA: aryl-sulfate sulfotransferase [Alphaproteobacteria bacterium]|nr:aryl-sulfate sulfotransferase [Alphaproteobacteria bacterium]